MNINLDTLVEIVEKQLILSEQDNVQSIYKTSVKLRTNNARAGETTIGTVSMEAVSDGAGRNCTSAYSFPVNG